MVNDILAYQFDNLIRELNEDNFITCNFGCENLKELEQELLQAPGVYLIGKGSLEAKNLIYIGCSGKLKKDEGGLIASNSKIMNRMRSSWTPYTFLAGSFFYNPKVKRSSKATDIDACRESYELEIPISELVFGQINLSSQLLASTCLEHLLIQSYINQIGNLPPANQEL